MEGASAKELNRTLSFRFEKDAEADDAAQKWISSDNTTERFFDYVLKKTC
jgi:hypothetical protein